MHNHNAAFRLHLFNCLDEVGQLSFDEGAGGELPILLCYCDMLLSLIKTTESLSVKLARAEREIIFQLQRRPRRTTHARNAAAAFP
jgi:hypothetical protein